MDTLDTLQFVWWQGVVEDRQDPLQLGRCRVRILGFHPQERSAVEVEQLPWAYPLQDITSAAMSGIGHAPVGPVEGTWVMGFFRDGEDAQQPIMMGTIGGIPHDLPCLRGLGFFDPNGIYPLVGSNPVQDAINKATDIKDQFGITLPKVAAVGVLFGADPALITQAIDIQSGVQSQVETVQGIADGVQSQVETAVGDAVAIAGGVTATPEQIQAVSKNIIANAQGQIDAAAAGVLSGAENQIAAVEGIVADAQDEIESAAAGVISSAGGLASSLGISSAVSGALAKLTVIGKGIERAAAPIIDAIKAAQEKALEEAASSVSSILDGLPGENAIENLEAIAAGTIEFEGLTFSTPGIGEPDTSRLARTDGTVIFGKSSEEHPVVVQKTHTLKIPGFPGVPIESIASNPNAPLDKDLRQIETANSFVTWFEPPTDAPFTEYPFNHVFESESGHVQEFDDTPGHERIHTFHTSGTFEEIHPDGSKMVKVVGTNYTIIHKDDNVLVKGDLNITVDDQARIKVQNTCDLEVVDGTLQIVVRNGNLNVQVQKGNANVFVKGDLTTEVQGNRRDTVLGGYFLDVKGTISIQAGGSVFIRGASIFLN